MYKLLTCALLILLIVVSCQTKVYLNLVSSISRIKLEKMKKQYPEEAKKIWPVIKEGDKR